MAELDTLYQDIILDHYRRPHGAGLREPYAAEVHHVNPTCGDEVTLRVQLDGDRVADVSYDALGCSISQAGASVAHEQLVGKPVGEAMSVLAGFRALMQSKGRVGDEGPDEDLLGDGVAFAGVAKFPGRVKCALLAWMAFEDAVTRAAADDPTTPPPIAEPSPQEAVMTQNTTPDHSDLPDLPPESTGSTVSVEDVTEAMKDVVDPELGINVVDLGLVYGVHVEEDHSAVIDMTLTSAACPLTDVIMDQTEGALEGLTNGVHINWVWMPPWGPDKITPDGREQLRALGFNV